jgi:hypothetical protein
MENFKRQLLLMLFLTTGLISYGQVDFKWDVIIDSLDLNRDQLYSKTKLFIGETWKSAQDVIQNDDKEAGVILVKGLCVKNIFFQMNDHRWTFSYNVKFYVKDKKCRIVIDNVYCESARCGQYEWPHMPVADKYPTEKGPKNTGLYEDRYLELMNLVKLDLQMIVDTYVLDAKKAPLKETDW